MIYSIYGKNDFLISLKKEKFINDFKNNNIEINIFDFDNSNNENFTQLKNSLDTLDLFSNKKAVIAKNIDEKNWPKEKIKSLTSSLKKIENSKDISIIFLTNKKLSFLSRIKTTNEECKKLETSELNKFINQLCKENDVVLTPKAKNFLTSCFSDNLGIIYNEIIKLSSYKKEIDDSDILNLINEPNLSNIFALTDAISIKNKTQAISLLFKEYHAGTSDLLIFGTIVSQIRNAILIKEYQKNPATRLDIHPFIQKKLASFVNSFDLKKLKIMYSKLFKYDLSIKKGKINPILSLELFINEII
jgi:DNA polymerase III delta subunit